MNRIQQIRRRAGPARRTDPAFAAWLEQAPAAAARAGRGSVYKVPVHTVVIGGLPGWRNALLAARGGTCHGHTCGAARPGAGRAPQDDHRGRLSDARIQVIRIISRPIQDGLGPDGHRRPPFAGGSQSIAGGGMSRTGRSARRRPRRGQNSRPLIVGGLEHFSHGPPGSGARSFVA
jgi:hypothetical protein